VGDQQDAGILASGHRLTPSDTTRSASTSRPESVSSSTAIFGLSRLELQDLVALLLSAGEALVHACARRTRVHLQVGHRPRTSLTQVRSLGASPRTAVTAVRRKFDTDTPGTSTGYCMARNRPARARSSTLIVQHVLAVEGDDRPLGDGVLRVPAMA
jgi:hypothetical protein